MPEFPAVAGACGGFFNNPLQSCARRNGLQCSGGLLCHESMGKCTLLRFGCSAVFRIDFGARIAPGQVVVSEQERAAALLPAPQHAVVERLMSLEQLPAGTWKMHPGDLPHGEATDLDDSGWQPVALLAHAPNDAVWFRQTVQIPDTLNGYDLTGARIWFQFHASANGPMPEMIYFNGRRVAMGEDLEPIVLFDDAHPGDKIVVAVKLLHTVDVKIFRGATMRVEFAEHQAESRGPGRGVSLGVGAAAQSCAGRSKQARHGQCGHRHRRCCLARRGRNSERRHARAGRSQIRREPEGGAGANGIAPPAAPVGAPSTSPATRISTRRGCGRGPRPSTWCGAPSRRHCS